MVGVVHVKSRLQQQVARVAAGELGRLLVPRFGPVVGARLGVGAGDLGGDGRAGGVGGIGRGQLLQRLERPAQTQVGHGQEMARLAVPRVQRQRPLQRVDRLRQVALLIERIAEEGQRLGLVGRGHSGLAQRRLRQPPLLLPQVGHAQERGSDRRGRGALALVQGGQEVGGLGGPLARHSPLQVRSRGGDVPRGQQQAQIIAGLRVRRGEGEGVPEGGDGLVPLAGRQQRTPQRLRRGEVAGGELARAAVPRRRLGRLPLGQAQLAQRRQVRERRGIAQVGLPERLVGQLQAPLQQVDLPGAAMGKIVAGVPGGGRAIGGQGLAIGQPGARRVAAPQPPGRALAPREAKGQSGHRRGQRQGQPPPERSSAAHGSSPATSARILAPSGRAVNA